MPYLDNFRSDKIRIECSFKTTNFEKTQVKHKPEFISSESQYNDSTFVDKLFKSVFKS